jgi:hypothetical protein
VRHHLIVLFIRRAYLPYSHKPVAIGITSKSRASELLLEEASEDSEEDSGKFIQMIPEH